MSYRPNHQHDPYSSRNGGHYPSSRDDHRDDRRGDGANTVANIVRLVTGVVVAIFVLHILFTVFDANQGNEFVSFVYGAAKVLVLGLGDVFTPNDALLGVVLNYGLAALVYLVVGQLVIKMLRR